MIELTLPYPPSVNTYWRHVGERVLISSKGRSYRLDVATSVIVSRSPRQQGRLAIEVDLYPPDKRRRDIDNTLKALLDSLQHGGLYEDDSQIDELCVRRHPPVDGGQCVVRVRECQ